MNRKSIVILIIFTILCAMLVACGQGQNIQDSDSVLDTTMGSEAGEELTDTEAAVNNKLNIDELTYPQYMALTPDRQKEVADYFESPEAFFEWYNKVKLEYEEFQNMLMNPGNTDETSNVVDATDSEATEQTAPPEEVKGITLSDYQAMSGAEQKRFISSFPSIDAFMQWHADAVQKQKDSMLEWGSENNKPTAPTVEIAD